MMVGVLNQGILFPDYSSSDMVSMLLRGVSGARRSIVFLGPCVSYTWGDFQESLAYCCIDIPGTKETDYCSTVRMGGKKA